MYTQFFLSIYLAIYLSILIIYLYDLQKFETGVQV